MTLGAEIRKILSHRVFWLIFALKLVCGTLLASHYLTDYAIPFVKYFIQSGFQNPWNYFYQTGQTGVFPYPPAMLLVLSIPHLLISPFMGINWQQTGFLDLFLMRLPILAADVGIFILLAGWYKNSYKKVLWFYWCSPLIFYINYYQGQLDAVSTALFLLMAYLLFSKRFTASAITLSVALATSGHLFITLPFYLVYCRKQGLGFKKLLLLCAVIAGGYLIFVSPVIFSAGYWNLVVKTGPQGNIFVLRFPFDLGGVKNLLLAPAALLILFIQFAAYEKLNRDITLLYFALVFVALILLTPPMPGWYYWCYPLIVWFFIRKTDVSLVSLTAFNAFYLLYFLTCQETDLFGAWKMINSSVASWISPLEFIKGFNFGKRVASDFVFTLLQSSVMAVAYWIYQEGVHSNELYKKKKKPLLIGIGGDSGAGKDTTVNCCRDLFGRANCIVVSGDDYHKWPRGHQEWKVYTHLNAYGNKLHDQLKDAIALRDGKSIAKVSYDHETGQFTNPETVDPGKIVFLVGLHPFYIEQMRNLYDIKIFIEPDDDLRKYWKIRRDMRDRGYTAAQVIEQMEKRAGDSSRFIQPQRQFVDIIIRFAPLNKIDFEHIEADEQQMDLKLTVTVNNSIFLEPLVAELKELPGFEAALWHEDDLKYQTLEVKGNVPSGKICEIADRVIPNLYEITASKPVWADDLMGVLQLVFLTCLSGVLSRDSYEYTQRDIA